MRKRINITLDDTLYHTISDIATKEYRSVSNMIEFILSEYAKKPGVKPTPALYYPESIRTPIITQTSPEQHKSVQTDTTVVTTTAGLSQPVQVKAPEVTFETTTASTPTQTPQSTTKSKAHPLAWLDKNAIDPYEVNEEVYKLLKKYYPDVTMNEFITYQHQRQDRYTPDPNDPMDPMINNPYLKNK